MATSVLQLLSPFLLRYIARRFRDIIEAYCNNPLYPAIAVYPIVFYFFVKTVSVKLKTIYLRLHTPEDFESEFLIKKGFFKRYIL